MDLSKMKQLQDQARKIKNELHSTIFDIELRGVKVSLTADQEVVGVTVNFERYKDNYAQFESDMVVVLNQGLKKSQEFAANNMREIMGDLMPPGLPKPPSSR